MGVGFSERRFFCLGASVILALIIAHLMTILLRFYIGHGTALGFVPMFDMNNEANVPAYFSSIMLLICAMAAGFVGGRKQKGELDRYRWLVLGAAFLFMSIDEFTSMHERFTEPFRAVFGVSSGLLYYAWVVPFGVLALAFAAAYLPFVLRLPLRARFLFFTAGFMYVSGAIGVEVFGGAFDARYGRENAVYALLVMLEESLEMLGIVAFATALMSYLASQYGEVRVVLRQRGSVNPPAPHGHRSKNAAADAVDEVPLY